MPETRHDQKGGGIPPLSQHQCVKLKRRKKLHLHLQLQLQLQLRYINYGP